MQKYFTMAALARRLGVDRTTVYDWLSRRKRGTRSAFPDWKTDEWGRRYWEEAEIARWQAAREKARGTDGSIKKRRGKPAQAVQG